MVEGKLINLLTFSTYLITTIDGAMGSHCENFVTINQEDVSKYLQYV